MKVASINVNGIRAARRKGLFAWLQTADLDFVCLQEIRADAEQIKEDEYWPAGYHCVYRSAERKGYSGVAILAKEEPDEIIDVIGLDWADEEGRYLVFEYANLRIASLYLPSGSHNPDRQEQKYVFMDHFAQVVQKYLTDDKPTIICGDYNIVHKEIDIKNWKSNQKNSGCLPEERAWLDKLFGKIGCVDAFRVVNQEDGQYTWWSNRGKAWDNNVGWRIDYQVISPDLAAKVTGAAIYKDERFSDHAPLIIEYSDI